MNDNFIKKTKKTKKIKTTKKEKKMNHKRKFTSQEREIIMLMGGDCGDGCTSGDFGTLVENTINTGVDIVKAASDVAEVSMWMIVDMPKQLLGAIESPSSNIPLTNII